MNSASGSMDCERAVERLYELLDEELTPQLTVDVQQHFENCARCFPLYNFERNFKRFLAARTRVQEAPPDLRRRVFEQTIFGDNISHE